MLHRPIRALGVFSFLLFLAPICLKAQTPIPLGEEFLISTESLERSKRPLVSGFSDGSYLVVWNGQEVGTSNVNQPNVWGRRFSSTGDPIGSEFQVNTYTTSDQFAATVHTLANDDFLAVWRSNGSSGTDTDQASLQGRRFSSDGIPIGDQYQINTYTSGWQFSAKVVADGSDGYTVVWTSEGSPGNDLDRSVQGQRFLSDGTRVGDQFQVNSYTTQQQYSADGFPLEDGGFMLVWSSRGSFGSDDDQTSIQGRRFSAEGDLLGQEFQINSTTTSFQRYTEVGPNGRGQFVVSWGTRYPLSGQTFSCGRNGLLFSADGSVIGTEFVVVPHNYIHAPGVSISSDNSGGFVVVWHDDGTSTMNHADIQGQRFSHNGTKVGDQFQVNTFTPDLQLSPVATPIGTGSFVVAWTSSGNYSQQPFPPSIRAQRYNAGGFVGEPFTCIEDSQTLCLQDGRFEVKARWRDFQGQEGEGHVVPGANSDSGLFWFFNSNNWEMLIKVLDGCSLNDRYWVFAAATTNVEYTLTVRDSYSGDSKSYTNSLGTASPAITDTSAFATCQTGTR